MKVAGLFEDPDNAEAACRRLRELGVAAEDVAMSRLMTHDGIAAESPGQSFENQPGQRRQDAAEAKFGEMVRGSACVVTVVARSDAVAVRIAELLQQSGAHGTAIPP